MDIIAHEERLVASGLKLEQAREIIRVVVANDAHAMTRADGERMEQKIETRLAVFDARFNAIDGKFDAMNSKIDAMTSKLIATAWTVGGVAVGILTAIRYLG
jgi:hypothetical protein